MIWLELRFSGRVDWSKQERLKDLRPLNVVSFDANHKMYLNQTASVESSLCKSTGHLQMWVRSRKS